MLKQPLTWPVFLALLPPVLVNGIRSGVARLHEVVNDMLDVSRIENRTFSIYPEPLQPRVVIQSIIRKLQPD